MYLIGDIGNTAIKICLFNNNLKLIKNIKIHKKNLNKNFVSIWVLSKYLLVMLPSRGSARFWLELLRKKLGSARLAQYFKKLGF